MSNTPKHEMTDSDDEIWTAPKESWGLVWVPEEGWRLVVPKADGGALVPDEGMALAGLFLRLTDTETGLGRVLLATYAALGEALLTNDDDAGTIH